MATIAILDDRITNRSIWAQLARSVDPEAQVETFEEPAAALSWLSKRTPDLVITDFKMPGMDGAEFIRQFRRMEDCEDIPVIVVTIYEDQQYRYEALDAGATDFLLSPVDHYEFKVRVRNLLTLSRQQQMLKERAEDLQDRLVRTDMRYKAELRESREKLARVIDSLPAMVYATDRRGALAFTNHFMAEYCGATPEEAMGRTVAELFGDAHGARDREVDQQVFEEGATLPGYEETIDDHMGVNRTFLISKSPLLSTSGNIGHVLTVALDITARKWMEEALKRAKEESEAANRAKTEFLANMSHELRTPLNAIIGFSEVMASEQFGPLGNERYGDYVRDIRDSATHLHGIINAILDLARIEEGEMGLEEEQIALDEIVASVGRATADEAESAGVALTIEISDLPPVRGDPTKLRQVLLNLISNAIKFSEPGGEVHVRGEEDDTGIVLRVSDNGIGMSGDELDVAKARFGQVNEGSLTKRYGGAGLGLPLSIALVELHGGRVDIDSVKGEGTSVAVTLPRERVVTPTGRRQ